MRILAIVLVALCAMRYAAGQETPLLSGGVAFLSSTNGGNTSYLPIAEPLLAAPIGNHLFIESRAAIVESIFPKGGGYDHSYTAGLTYLQGAYLASSHLSVVGGSYLVPFLTYNERLSPVWINNLQDGPLIANLSLLSTGTGVGGMLRGSGVSRRKFSIDYAAFFSARSTNQQFNARRSTGARSSVYFPDQRLEVGFSYARLLEGTHENFFGTHVWWEPANTGLRVRSEYGRGEHAQGYWIEADYRVQAFGGSESWIGRLEPVFRMQQTFGLDSHATSDLSTIDAKRPDFGIDYNLPHNTRILTSYSRQFSPAGNRNIWETGIVYRFLFPAWKGK
jgi:hypothetical protein